MGLRIALFGFPGAGKGTQAQRLALKLHVPHLSTGDIFRSLQNKKDALAEELRSNLSKGELVSDSLVTKIVFARLSEKDCNNGFILDGFPRTLAQAICIMESPYVLDMLININVSKESIINRLSGRRLCQKCGSIYNISDFSHKDHLCCKNDGTLLIQRPDDAPKAIETRLKLFEENYTPIINYFKELGLLRSVDGDASPDQVFSRLLINLDVLE